MTLDNFWSDDAWFIIYSFSIHPAVGFHGLQACVTTMENLEERHCWLSSTAVATLMTVQAVSAKAGLFYFLICLASQRSERPSDLWHSRRSAEHIPMIRKEKPSTARTHGTACHTAGLHTSLSHIAAQSLLFRTTSPSILWALAMKKACPWGYMWLTMWQQNLDYCRGSKILPKGGGSHSNLMQFFLSNSENVSVLCMGWNKMWCLYTALVL